MENCVEDIGLDLGCLATRNAVHHPRSWQVDDDFANNAGGAWRQHIDTV
jgi:hypothetical protein